MPKTVEYIYILLCFAYFQSASNLFFYRFKGANFINEHDDRDGFVCVCVKQAESYYLASVTKERTFFTILAIHFYFLKDMIYYSPLKKLITHLC